MAKRAMKQSLTGVFMTYFMSVVASSLLVVLLAVLGSSLALRTGLVLPANQGEAVATSLKEEIEAPGKLDFTQLPDYLTYTYLDEAGQVKSSNMSKAMQEVAKSEDLSDIDHARYGYFKSYQRPDGTQVILQYRLQTRYGSNWMNQHLPSPFILGFGLFGLILITLFITLSLFFGRYISQQLQPIMTMTQKIGQHDLEFQTPKSKVTEFQQIISGLDRMRTSLRQSLLETWQTRQEQIQQISALTHDLKTPLTVIKGNTDLLELTELTAQQKEFISYTKRNVQTLDDYVQDLNQLAKSQRGYELVPETVSLAALFEDIEHDARGLAGVHQLSLDITAEAPNRQANWDVGLLKRAIMNVITNAMEHSPEGTQISLAYHGDTSSLTVTITDSGPGFTQEALQSAKQAFFTTDTSRNKAYNHQGLGLAIAENAISLHGGRLELCNTELGHGQVIITLPLT